MTVDTENVINMPTRLERLAKNIKEALANVKGSRTVWIDNLMSAAAQLLEAREEFKDNQSFGQWLLDNDIKLNVQDRAALIAMAREPTTMKAVLAETDRTSPQLIYAQYRGRFSSPRKTEPAPRPPPVAKAKPQPRMDPAKPRPKEAKAREAVRAHVEAGVAFDARELGKELDISHVLVEQAAAVERAVNEVHREYAEMPLVDFDTVPLSKKLRFDAIKRRLERDAERTLKARLAAIDEEVRQRVLKETEEHLALLKRRQEEVNEEYTRYVNLNNDYKPIYTEEEWTTLFRVAHPDNSASADMRSRAFNLIRAKKLQLTGKK